MPFYRSRPSGDSGQNELERAHLNDRSDMWKLLKNFRQTGHYVFFFRYQSKQLRCEPQTYEVLAVFFLTSKGRMKVVGVENAENDLD